MVKAELTKTIEARKLNKRTMRALSPDPVTIPFGGILDKIESDDYVMRFFYLGEPFETDLMKVKGALKSLE
ncbi:MAG: hypothetical protein JST65_03365 [Acidobacteria bacterium]|nr:hypothetical protein [Acidobacteriota bacterium]